MYFKKKAIQKINHIKKNVPIMFDIFFGPGAAPVKAKAANRFVVNWKKRVEKNHAKLINLWNKCGTASMDESFEARLDFSTKFDKSNPMVSDPEFSKSHI